MFGGKPQTTSFTYTGSDINDIQDRLPTATAVKQEDGSYLVTAEIYGEMGLNLWLKGQENVILSK